MSTASPHVDLVQVESVFRRHLRGVMILPLLALVVAAVLLVGLVLHLHRLNSWVDHTDVVIGRAHLVERLAIDAQSRFRAYLLTGNTQVLQTYRDASALVVPAIDRLRALVGENPAQLLPLVDVRANLERWREYSQEEIGRKTTGEPITLAATRLNEGAEFMGNIRRSLHRFIEDQELLRVRRVERADRATRQALFAGAALALLFGPVIALATAREMRCARRSYLDALQAQERAARAAQESREQFRELVRHQQALLDQEQMRISRELHDEMGQLLTALRLDVEAIEEGLSDAQEPRRAALLDRSVDASELAAQAVAALQRVLADLRPATLDRLGLCPALREEGRRFQERTGLRCVVRVPDGREGFGPELDTAIFRIAQEALTNVARHAHAEAVTVTLDARNGGLLLRVQDDGRGIDLVSGRRHALGIAGMRERTERLGGELTVEAADPRGTAVCARFPVEPAHGGGRIEDARRS